MTALDVYNVKLHGIALAIHSVLRARDRAAITPVQVELQAVVSFSQASSLNPNTAVDGDFDCLASVSDGFQVGGSAEVMKGECSQ